MSFIQHQKEEAGIIADAIRQGLGSVAEHVKDAIRGASIRQGEVIADDIAPMGNSLDKIADNLATVAEADADGKTPANVADGLFAVARAIDRLAAVGEAFAAGYLRDWEARPALKQPIGGPGGPRET
jgi:hypothetical protein